MLNYDLSSSELQNVLSKHISIQRMRTKKRESVPDPTHWRLGRATTHAWCIKGAEPAGNSRYGNSGSAADNATKRASRCSAIDRAAFRANRRHKDHAHLRYLKLDRRDSNRV